MNFLQKLSVITLVSLAIFVAGGVIPTFAQTNPTGTPIVTELKLGNSNGACEAIGGSWNSGTSICTLNTNLTFWVYDSLTIDHGTTLVITNTISNIGTVANNGTINNKGNITNAGIGIIINNGGTIINSGQINNDGDTVNYGGTITNSGTINNKGIMANSGGTVNNSGTLNGNPIMNTDKVSSGYPINTKCEDLLWIVSQSGGGFSGGVVYQEWIFKKIVEKGLVEQTKKLYDDYSQELTDFYQNHGSCTTTGCDHQVNAFHDKLNQQLNTLFIDPTLPSKFMSLQDFGNFEKEALNEPECLSMKNTSQSTSSPSTQTQPALVITPTQQDIKNINQAKANQTIAAEVNVGANQSTTTIDNNISVQTTSNTPDSLNVNVSASSQTGPKVIAFNLNATTINVSNLKDLGVMYDGKLIQPAPNMDAILHAKPTDNPSFAIIVTQSGIQVLVLVPHFSTHSITIMNMSKVMTTTIPEFPFTAIVLVIATFSIILIPKIKYH